MSIFGGGRTGRTQNGVYTSYNQGLTFASVAQGSATQGVDSVTWASGVAMWQGNDNTVIQGNKTYPLMKAAGHDVYRMETRPGDQGHSSDSPSVKTRSMLIGSNHPNAFNTDTDTSFSFLVEPGYYFSTTFCTLLEFQGTQDAAPDANNSWPPYFLTIQPSGGGNLRFRVERRTDNSINLIADPGANLLVERQVTRGERHHIYMRNKWTSSGTGTHSLYLDGTQIVNYSGATGYNDAVGPWLGIGCYHDLAPTGTAFAMQIANFEHSTSSLSARIASPLAW